jgi:hypothetical protein
MSSSYVPLYAFRQFWEIGIVFTQNRNVLGVEFWLTRVFTTISFLYNITVSLLSLILVEKTTTICWYSFNLGRKGYDNLLVWL